MGKLADNVISKLNEITPEQLIKEIENLNLGDCQSGMLLTDCIDMLENKTTQQIGEL